MSHGRKLKYTYIVNRDLESWEVRDGSVNGHAVRHARLSFMESTEGVEKLTIQT